MTSWTWLTWPDPMIDFGREVYVPWQLSEGAVLYRDIAYHNGPLSPYINALLFRLFIPSLHVLFLFNGILALAMLGLLRAWGRLLAGRAGSLIASLAFILLFAFARFLPYGNYNWLAPYSHEMTHGLLLATASLLCLVSDGTFRTSRVFIGGILAGLTFLTKSEIFVALAFAVAAWFVFHAGPKKPFALLGGFIVPLFACFLLFLPALSAAEAAAATAGAWKYVITGGVKSVFSQTYMGADSLGTSLSHLASSVLSVAGVLILLTAIAWRFFGKSERAGAGATIIAFVVTSGVLLLAGRVVELDYAFLGLPVWVATILVLAAVRPNKTVNEAVCVFSVFALALLLRVILSAQIIHYGFVLALPATVLCACALFDWLPAAVETHSPGAARICKAGIAGLFAGTTLWFMQVMNGNLAAQNVAVGSEGDIFRADARGAAVQQSAGIMRTMLNPSDTLIVIPESEMLNYLLRVRNPTPYGNFNPHQLEIFGEERMVAALKENPPTYVIWADRIYDEYGADYFGKDYGLEMAGWISENYDVIRHLAPGSKLMESRMPILLLQRK